MVKPLFRVFLNTLYKFNRWRFKLFFFPPTHISFHFIPCRASSKQLFFVCFIGNLATPNVISHPDTACVHIISHCSLVVSLISPRISKLLPPVGLSVHCMYLNIRFSAKKNHIGHVEGWKNSCIKYDTFVNTSVHVTC